MELNIVTLLYLFFRLAPFVIVCFFSLSSLFNQDIKGLIYLVGLLLACFFTVMVGNSLSEDFTLGNDQNPVCNLITIGVNGSFSKIPLGISILTYTLIYLVYVIAKYNQEMNNLPTLILFPLLILADLVWNIKNSCYQPYGIIISIIIGGAFGAIWAAIIDSMKKPDLFFLSTGSNRETCSRPSKQLFKCTFKNPK